MAKREVAGVWWLSTNPEKKWVGELTLETDETPTLRLTVPEGFFDVSDWPVPSVVHGHDQNGDPITLLFTSRPGTSGGAALTKVNASAGTAVIGMQLANASSFMVNRLILSMQHLLEWSGMTGFINQRLPSDDDLSIRYKFPATKRFQINAHLRVDLETVYSQTNNFEGKVLEEDLLLSFHSEAGLGYEQVNDLVRAMRQLLHFALIKRVYPTRVTAHRNEYGDTLDGKFYPHNIELFNSLLRDRVQPENHPDRWIFKFSDVGDDFGKFMAIWLSYTERFEETLSDYFATIYHRLPAAVEHLCLTQALDAYHGFKFNSHEERGYRKKVQQLIEPHASFLQGLIDDPADFAKIIEDNRNWYTHHNPKWKKDGRVVSNSALLRVNEKLKLIIQMNVLSDLKIPTDRFKRLRMQLASLMIDYSP